MASDVAAADGSASGGVDVLGPAGPARAVDVVGGTVAHREPNVVGHVLTFVRSRSLRVRVAFLVAVALILIGSGTIANVAASIAFYRAFWLLWVSVRPVRRLARQHDERVPDRSRQFPVSLRGRVSRLLVGSVIGRHG